MKPHPLRVCVLEDPRVPNNHLGRRLRAAGLRVEVLADEPTRFLSLLARRLPEVAVVDASHPGGDRLGVLETLARTYPGMRTLAAVPRTDGPIAHRCRASGAFDCVAKPRGSARSLARAIEAAHRAPTRAAAARLTPREDEVLRALGAGTDNLKIAAQLGITERTVKAHVTSLYRKLGAESRVELALAGRAIG